MEKFIFYKTKEAQNDIQLKLIYSSCSDLFTSSLKTEVL